MRASTDPCRLVQAKGYVVVARRHGLGIVQTHPHPDCGSRRPRVGHECDLPGQTSAERIRGIVEDDHQCVTLRGDLDAAVVLEGLGQESVVGIEQSDVLVASFPEEPGRALDVRHNERDDASRQSERSLGRLHGDQPSARPTCPPAAPVWWPPYSWKALQRMAWCSSGASPRRQPTPVSREVAPSMALQSSVNIGTGCAGIQIVSATSCPLVSGIADSDFRNFRMSTEEGTGQHPTQGRHQRARRSQSRTTYRSAPRNELT
jgi:hypothetical protein